MKFLHWVGGSVLFLALLLSFSSSSGQEPPYDTSGCWTSASAPASTSGIDTIKAIAIYACRTTAFPTTLPIWADSIWDSSRQLSVPRYFKDNSLGKYIMTGVASGRTSTTCWTSPYAVPNPVGGGSDEPSGFQFFEDVMKRADTVVNFANFDQDQDDTVDACFFIVVNHGGHTGAWLGHSTWSYRTKDVNSTGDTVIVAPDKLALIRSSQEKRALAVCAHEWGHALFGPTDWYGSGGKTNYGLGAFSIMGYEQGFPQDIAVPVDPVHRVSVGWVTPITVTSPLYQQTIPDYLTTGTIYRLTHTSNQFFYVTNYKGADPSTNPANIWQVNYAGHGLLIWHVGGPKGIDVELAHGLYNLNSNCDTISSNPISGKDSLDCANKPAGIGYNPNNVQSPTCFWNSLPTHNKTIFDGKSNPSSHASINSSPDSTQHIPTHLAVRRLTTASTPGSAATADLLVNNWFGYITQNTTWGPNKVFAITGDITVDAGVTLTIQPGTTIYFQRNEDNESSGSDNARCEIIVKNNGTLRAIGTATDSIKFLPSPGTNGQYDWHSVKVEPGGSAEFAYCQFKYAYTAIDYRNSTADTVKNCLFEKNFMHGVISNNPKILILNSSFIDQPNYGVYLDQADDTISGCYFKNNQYGINAYKSYGKVSNNTIIAKDYSGTFGFRAEGYQAGETRILDFTNNLDSGQFFDAAVVANNRVKIQCSRIRIVRQAIFPVPDPPPFNIGILNDASDAVTVRTTVMRVGGYTSNAAPNVQVDGGTPIDLGQTGSDAGNNSIVPGTGGKAVNNTTGNTVLAQNNWWGTANPPASYFAGPVNRSPALGSEPTPCSPVPRITPGGEDGILPRVFSLSQNYPNPFNPTTNISFSLPFAEKVVLTIYNILGQKVKTLADGEKYAGTHMVVWDGTDNRGAPVSSGIYFYKIEAASFREVKRMVFVK